MKTANKRMTCDCGGRYQETTRDFDGIACPAMVCDSCGDIVFTVEQSKRYHELRLKKAARENCHGEIPSV